VTYSDEPLTEPEFDPEEDELDFDEPVEDPESETDILNGADDDLEDEDLPLVDATENGR
jgi:hypothetical protein